MVKSTFEGNKAEALGNIDQRGPIGGAIVMIDIDKATIIDTTFNNNTASSRGAENVPGYGGAVYIKVQSSTDKNSPKNGHVGQGDVFYCSWIEIFLDTSP